MLATATSATLLGVEGRPVSVEAHVSSGLPGFSIVGLPDAACRESRDRVRAAILSSGLSWPQRRVTINLAPSGVRKAGSGLDLPIAVALLAADDQLPPGALDGMAFLGELGLDGSLRPVPGVLPLIDALTDASVVVPVASAREASLVGRHRVCPASSLGLVAEVLRGEERWLPPAAAAPGDGRAAEPDLLDVRGQAAGRLAVEVAAAGGHHLLLVGPPGAGKTMLARRLPGLLPALPTDEALEVTRIHSAAGLPLPEGALVRRPPFRSPHHSSSMVSLIGGGTSLMRPGEVSCASHGVLFLDELGEFTSSVLDTLRQPIEEGQVLVCRARASMTFPAAFLLVAAMNPCPCGQGTTPGACRCSDVVRERYAGKVSGPLLDRFDLRVTVDPPDRRDLMGGHGPPPESSATVAARVAAARELAASRGVGTNAAIPARRLDELAPLEPVARTLVEEHLGSGRLSARGMHRIRRVARTLADLAGHEGPVRGDDVHAALVLRSDPLGTLTVAA